MTIDVDRVTRRHRAHRPVAALAMLLLAALSLGAARADSGAPDAHGYWFMSPIGAADPSVPEDGLLVAGVPSGPVSVAALRFTLDDPEVMAASVHLTIDQDTADIFLEEPLIYACPVEADWEPVQGGDAEQAPGDACSPGSSAQAKLSEDGDEYVFVVSNFIEDGVLDILITPGVRGAVPSPLLLQLLNDEAVELIGTGAPWPGPETLDGLDGSNFRVTFEAPGADTLRTGADSADTSVTELSFDGENAFSSDFDAPDDGGDGPGTSTGSVAAPPTTSTGPGAGGATESGGGGAPAASPTPQTADPPRAATGGEEQEIQASPPGGEGSEPPVTLEDPQATGMPDAEPARSLADPRMLGAIVLALGALAAGAMALGPRGLALGAAGRGAGGGTDGLGGLAQFARPRSGPPPSL